MKLVAGKNGPVQWPNPLKRQLLALMIDFKI